MDRAVVVRVAFLLPGFIAIFAGCGGADSDAGTKANPSGGGGKSGVDGGKGGSPSGGGWVAAGGASGTSGTGAIGGAGGTGGSAGTCFDVESESADWGSSGDSLVGRVMPVVESSIVAKPLVTQNLRQPFAQTSYICQSYRGYSHKSGYALDIGVTPQSCNAGNDDSGGKDVVAPAAGKVTKLPTSGLGAYLCIQLDGGGAIALGHVKGASGIAQGTVVKKGQKVATVAHSWDSASGNAGIAHLHFEAFDGTGCYNGNNQPFDGAFAMDCAPELPFNATYGYYNGTKLQPCPTKPAVLGKVAMLYATGETEASVYSWASNGSALALQSPQWSSKGYALERVGDRMASGDFDGDGNNDIAAAMQLCDGTTRIHVWHAGASGFTFGGAAGFANAPLDASSGDGRFVGGDFDGDAKDELALLYARPDGGTAIALYPDGVDGWSVDSGYPLSNVGDRFVAGDFDGDGKDDVATAYQYPDGYFRFHVWRGNGKTLTYSGSDGWYQSGPYALDLVAGRMAAGDFDGDGKHDIALFRNHGSSGAKLWVWLSTGSSFALSSSAWSVESGYDLSNVGNRFVATDVDADGLDDVVTAYQYPDGTFRFHVWRSTGGAMTYDGSSGWYASGSFDLANVDGRLVAR